MKLARRTAEVEATVLGAHADALAGGLPGRHALLAVGGFGRRELFPCSDVDLLLLVEFEPNLELVRERLSRFLKTLWDAHLRPSHSVRTAEECLTLDPRNVELSVSLLDRRFLAGDQALYQWLDERFTRFERGRGSSLARELVTLVRQRHHKFQNSIYHLEPDVKDGPGGLRDLHVVKWFDRLRPGGETALDEAHEFFACTRTALHERAGRDHNVLTFDDQEALSSQPAALMRDYYRHARVVSRLLNERIEATEERSSSLLQSFRDWRSRLSTTDFTVSHDRVYLRSQPRGLEPFEFAARHQLDLAPDALRRLAAHAPVLGWNDWIGMLSLPRPSRGLRAMQESGVLAAVLPAWRAIECLVVRDFYHRYTVDEHTLVAIEALESIDDPRFAGIFEEIDQPALLRFALLLHDIGKGSGDHVPASVWIASSVLESIGAPPAERDTVLFLVEHHLMLSSTMNSRDPSESSTARLLAERVGTIERLRMLTLLTWADISAVNPSAMNPWRREQLWRIYLTAHEELTRELDRARLHDLRETTPERAAFLEGLPVRYLRTHTAAEIDQHIALAAQLSQRSTAIDLVRQQGVYRLTLVTHDAPGLLAAAAGTLSSFGMNILKAEAFGNEAGLIVDTFVFADPLRTLELNPEECQRLTGTLRRVLEGKQDVERLLKGRARPSAGRKPRLSPRVAFNQEASDAATLIEVVAEDRPGLLYDLTHAISEAGCNIEVVLIDTEAHKALDVFYVTREKKKLDAGTVAVLESTMTRACAGIR